MDSIVIILVALGFVGAENECGEQPGCRIRTNITKDPSDIVKE